MAVFGVLAAGWASLLVLAPYLPVPVAAFLYVFGSRICHQIPERSIVVAGAQLPVCARCSGIYVGLAVAGLAWASLWRFGDERSRGSVAGRVGSLLAIGLTALTINGTMVVGEWVDLWDPSNAIRALAGSALGAAAALAVGGAIGKLHYSPCRTRRYTPAPPVTRT